MRYILFLLVMTFSFTSQADVYQQTDAKGNVVFSDTPLNAQAVRIQSGGTGQAVGQGSSANQPANNPVESRPNFNVPVRKPYLTFKIASPADQESIQNQPSLQVSVSIDPPLFKGDAIQIFLDGMPWSAPQATTFFSFTAPDRGTHTLTAKVFDAQGLLVKQSADITIYVHHAHTGSPAS